MISGITVLAFDRRPRRAAPPLLRWSMLGLVSVSWVSAAAFGMYILAFYITAITAHHLEQWNKNLPGLYAKGDSASLIAMAIHLLTGGIILLLGPVQLIGSLRNRWPALHRWLGRLYVLTSAIAGLGGLAFIVTKGTIGGTVMNIGFGLYGALMVFAAFESYRYARKRQFEAHRAWSIRLFALAIGSWLYRMDYGFWLLLAHGVGHTHSFNGPFDAVMSFFFYLPNLVIAEIFVRGKQQRSHSAFRFSAALVLNTATLVVAIGSYYFIRFYWGPGILNGLLGKSG